LYAVSRNWSSFLREGTSALGEIAEEWEDIAGIYVWAEALHPFFDERVCAHDERIVSGLDGESKERPSENAKTVSLEVIVKLCGFCKEIQNGALGLFFHEPLVFVIARDGYCIGNQFSLAAPCIYTAIRSLTSITDTTGQLHTTSRHKRRIEIVGDIRHGMRSTSVGVDIAALNHEIADDFVTGKNDLLLA
jgi:hypothetical protein